ncbi:polymer-forming cytoskeletal protein [Microseira sp. BLCC-F43]|uniref:polymer-forming cytoskeletal protein n=1 Tax=Microseira sp. BLCC-F43 TaxID=3153602 RepID=UPI0035B9D3D0
MKDFIPLAKLTISSNVVKGDIDNSVRVYSGLRLPSPDGEISLSFKSYGSGSFAEFNSSLKVRGKLSVTESATFDNNVTTGNLIVNGETNLKGKLSVTDNATFTGKVVIGTIIEDTEPTQKLEVNRKVKASELEVVKVKTPDNFSSMASFESKNTDPPYVNWLHNRTGGNSLRYGYIQGGDFGNSKELRFFADNGANFTFLNSNVGIGTKNTPQRLSVQGGIGFTGDGLNANDKKLYSPADGVLEWMTHEEAIGHGFAVSHQGEKKVFLNINGDSYFKGGNVGIGTATPSANLTIQTPADYSGDTIRFEAKKEPSLYYLNLNTNVTAGVVRWVFAQKNNNTTHPNVLAFDRGNVGIGTTTPSAKLEVAGNVNVAGIIQAKGYKTAIFTAGGLNETEVTLSSVNTWFDFPSLSRTFTLSATATVIAFYKISMANQETDTKNAHFVTRLFVDNTEVSRTITGNTTYWGNSDFWVGELAQGEHTIKVQYRTPAGAKNNPQSSDWQNRVLRVMIFGS